MSALAGVIRMEQLRAGLLQGVREGRQAQQVNRETVAHCERENRELDELIQSNKDAIAMLDRAISRERAKLPRLAVAAE